ncbi:MAG: hypothetical protein K6T73_07780 [Candidatus Bathyarchaeota archaeon]|nr:hypothetical protein [Candidatus Bathyarchaeota archaeon]
MSEKEEVKKTPHKIRVWINRPTHEKVAKYAKSAGIKIIEAYDTIVMQGIKTTEVSKET